jgi:hypothetical protein
MNRSYRTPITKHLNFMQKNACIENIPPLTYTLHRLALISNPK